MEEERREKIRIKKELVVRYCYNDKDEKKWDMTAIRDISETGMCITTHRQFSLNDIVTFLIKIPSRPLEWIEFTGRVVGSEELKAISGKAVAESHITRVEFINLKEEEKTAIRLYVEWFLSQKGGESQ